MIPIEEAENILNQISFSPKSETVPLMDALGCILAENITSSISMPPFDKSAMDGYAIISGDDSTRFKIVEIIGAGSIPNHALNKGECSKIMTGAMLPPNANRVIKVEVTEEKDGYMQVKDEDKHLNICYLGEDIKPGDMVLKKGHLIRPPEIGIIASMGLIKVKVFEKPVVGIITTGSEVVEPGRKLEKGQIYNSNAYSISAQVLQMGALVKYAGIVSDDKESLRENLQKLLDSCGVVLISGGVSMGDFDFVPQILEELGVHLFFKSVAIQPGKPTVFGQRNNTLVFGMPGNPVSTFTVFEVLVKRVLFSLMGYDYSPIILEGRMKKDFSRKRADRTAYVPVKYNGDATIEPLEYHGSAHLSALADANGLLKIPTGTLLLEKGKTVYVRQI